MITLDSLPPIMKQRAEWARNEIINHPVVMLMQTEKDIIQNG